MGWTHKVWIFIATGTSTTIDFTSLSLPGSSAGPALDDVGLFGGGIPAFLPIGQGCPGTAGTPLLSPNQLPRIGHPFSFIVYNLPLNQLGLAFLGFSSQSWGGYSLPLSMTPFGMDGCTLYTSVDIAQLVPDLGIFGTYIWGTQIPSDPGLLGVYFGMQFLVNDPGANSAGLILSNAGFGLIGA